MSNASPINKVI